MAKVTTVSENNSLAEAGKDYATLEEEMKYWECENTHKPFSKNIVCVLGVYSSGKSSLTNHFFKVGIQIVAPTQQDTIFTMIETIDEDSFAILSQERTGEVYKRFRMSEELITTPCNPASDKRRNRLYITLDTASTLARHQQFDDFSKVFREYNLISCILINEYYLRGTEEEINMYKNTIIIDSPGFTSEMNVGKLKGNLRILKYFYQLSDLILFLASADSLSNISSEVTLLELSILYALEGEAYFGQALNEILGEKKDSQKYGVLDFFGSFFSRFSNLARNELGYDGTSHWNKVHFVITKLDIGRRCSCNRELRGEGQFFELGITLGRTLKFLKPPTFDNTFAISIPDQVKATVVGSNNNGGGNNAASPQTKMTGDLRRLINTIKSLNYFNSYAIRMENSIQKMCSDLKAHIDKRKYMLIPTTSYGTIERISARSKQRLTSRLQGNLQSVVNHNNSNTVPSVVFHAVPQPAPVASSSIRITSGSNINNNNNNSNNNYSNNNNVKKVLENDYDF